jgi:hypothetical protein
MDIGKRQMIEARVRAISEELGLLEPAQLRSALSAPEHDLEELEVVRRTRAAPTGA